MYTLRNWLEYTLKREELAGTTHRLELALHALGGRGIGAHDAQGAHTLAVQPHVLGVRLQHSRTDRLRKVEMEREGAVQVEAGRSWYSPVFLAYD